MGSDFRLNVEALLKGMEDFVNTKTVVGEPITVNDTIILPLVDVSFGVGAGAYGSKKEGKDGQSGGGALGAKISPAAVLVIKDGVARLVNIKNQDSLSKIIDMAPDLMDKFTANVLDRKGKKDKESKELNREINEEIDIIK